MKAVGDIFALGDDTYALWKVFLNLRHEQGIVSTAKDEGIDLRVEAHNLIDALLDEVVGTRGVSLIIFYEGYPERASHARHGNVWVEFLDFEIVTLALDGTLGGKYADMA